VLVPSRFRAGFDPPDLPQPPTRSRGTRLLAGAVLLAAALFLLVTNIDFARFAVTGFFWVRANGTVLSAQRTSIPSIQFATPDGAAHLFTENYLRLCGRRSFCYRRDFTPGESVPVVYDPAAPARAFVWDWALFANVLSWFFEAALALILALMCLVLLRARPLAVSIEFGSRLGRD
jgi:hypothetical protein